jgi:hypothetical protein
MGHSQSAVQLLVLALLWGFHGNGEAQNTVSPSSAKHHVLYLKNTNTGQHITAAVGQPIQITLQTIGPGEYDSPQISSSAIRFESVAFAKEPIPAGPTQIYRFRAVSEGEAQVKIPHVIQIQSSVPVGPITDANPIFTVMVRVYEQRKP